MSVVLVYLSLAGLFLLYRWGRRDQDDVKATDKLVDQFGGKAVMVGLLITAVLFWPLLLIGAIVRRTILLYCWIMTRWLDWRLRHLRYRQLRIRKAKRALAAR